MKGKPLWKEAIELAEKYKEYGVDYRYFRESNTVDLSLSVELKLQDNHRILNCLLGGVADSRHIDYWVKRVLFSYVHYYKHNDEMLKLVEKELKDISTLTQDNLTGNDPLCLYAQEYLKENGIRVGDEWNILDYIQWFRDKYEYQSLRLFE